MDGKFTIFALLISATMLVSCGNEDKGVAVDVVKNTNSADGKIDTEEIPVVVFTEDAFDFGTVSEGEKVMHSFTFKNEGEGDLVIASAKGSCGCTVPKWPKEPIGPGEEGLIDVIFDSDGKVGKIHKTVTVVANTDPQTTVLAIRGEVVGPTPTK